MNDPQRAPHLDSQAKRAQGGVGAPHLHDDEEAANPANPTDSVTPGVDVTERQTITSGIAQTSEVADRDAQDDAEGQGDGTLQHQ